MTEVNAFHPCQSAWQDAIGQPTPLITAAPLWASDSRAPFDEHADPPALLVLALAHAPAAFKRRNIFTPAADLQLRQRAGRPAKSLHEKRRNNAESQRRFRQARRNELATLRKLARFLVPNKPDL